MLIRSGNDTPSPTGCSEPRGAFPLMAFVVLQKLSVRFDHTPPCILLACPHSRGSRTARALCCCGRTWTNVSGLRAHYVHQVDATDAVLALRVERDEVLLRRQLGIDFVMRAPVDRHARTCLLLVRMESRIAFATRMPSALGSFGSGTLTGERRTGGANHEGEVHSAG